MTNYYDRLSVAHLDGSPVFKTEEDEANEKSIASRIEQAWGCKLCSFGRLAQVDWWAERDGRVVGYLELKSRSHEHRRYPDVFLNQRKWLALTLMQLSGPPAIFVVRFTDADLWIPINKIDPSNLRIGGCNKLVKSRNDREPVILVDVGAMKPIAT